EKFLARALPPSEPEDRLLEENTLERRVLVNDEQTNANSRQDVCAMELPQVGPRRLDESALCASGTLPVRRPQGCHVPPFPVLVPDAGHLAKVETGRFRTRRRGRVRFSGRRAEEIGHVPHRRGVQRSL